jgi:hypothetical protein
MKPRVRAGGRAHAPAHPGVPSRARSPVSAQRAARTRPAMYLTATLARRVSTSAVPRSQACRARRSASGRGSSRGWLVGAHEGDSVHARAARGPSRPRGARAALVRIGAPARRDDVCGLSHPRGAKTTTCAARGARTPRQRRARERRAWVGAPRRMKQRSVVPDARERRASLLHICRDGARDNCSVSWPHRARHVVRLV